MLCSKHSRFHERASKPAKDRMLKLLPDVDSSPSPARRKGATLRFPRQFGCRLHPSRNKLVFNRSRLSTLFETTATHAYVYGPTTTPDITVATRKWIWTYATQRY